MDQFFKSPKLLFYSKEGKKIELEVFAHHPLHPLLQYLVINGFRFCLVLLSVLCTRCLVARHLNNKYYVLGWSLFIIFVLNIMDIQS